MEESTPSSFPSLPKRLLQVLFSPGEVFTALREKPVWFGALAVVGVLVVLSAAVLPAEVWVEFFRNQMIEQGQEVPAGMEAGGSIIRVVTVLISGISVFIMAFILAGIMTLIFSFLLGGEGRYVQYLSIVAHAFIVTALGALLLVPLKILQADPTVTLSLGTFALTFMDEGYPLRVLKLVDLFSLWSYAIMAVGVTKIDPKRSFGSAFGIFVGIAVAFALIFGLFGG